MFLPHHDAALSCPALPHPALPCSTDESALSLLLPLNDAFVGGGTFFVDPNPSPNPNLQAAVRPRPGQVLLFRGGEIVHGGDPVLAGTRYVIAAFIFIDQQDQDQDDNQDEDPATNNTNITNTAFIADTVKKDTDGDEVENHEGGKSKTFQFSFNFS